MKANGNAQVIIDDGGNGHPGCGFSGLPQFVDEMHLVVGTAITANFTPPTIPYTH